MTSALSGMSVLLSAVAQAAHPDEVAAALVKGPGSAYDATSGAILWRRGDQLIVLGLYGYRPSEVEGFAGVNLNEDYPLVRAFLEGEVVIDSTTTVADDYSAMAKPGSRWRALADRLEAGSIVSAPILCDGSPIGAYALNCTTDPVWSSLDIAVLDSVSAALGLWLTHPDSGLPVAPGSTPPEVADLSPRQVAILRMVATGRTNTAIAQTLGVSVSTVKQDLTRAMGHLDASDRTRAAEAAQALGLFEGISS